MQKTNEKRENRSIYIKKEEKKTATKRNICNEKIEQRVRERENEKRINAN